MVPVKLDEPKKLPMIPNTGVRIKKKNLTDLVPGQNCLSLNEAHEEDEDTDSRTESRHQNRSKLNSTHLNNTVADEDTTTVFDLVHRGRQRQQHFREMKKQ